jgi:hypothetical protein
VARLKTYPELNTAALRTGHERPLSVWYLLRYLDRTGAGVVREPALRRFVASQELFGRDTLRRALRKGDGAFWRRSSGFVEYRSLFKVATALGAELHKLPVLLDVDDFGSMGRMRPMYMATWFADRPRRMSRAAQAALIGKSAQTTRNYSKRAGLHVRRNSMYSQRKVSDFGPELEREGYYRTQVDGQTRLAKRLPNTYHADLECCPFGQVKHYRREASLSTRGVPERRYFTNTTAALKALHQTDTGSIIYLKMDKTDVFDSQLWIGTMMMDGVTWTC